MTERRPRVRIAEGAFASGRGAAAADLLDDLDEAPAGSPPVAAKPEKAGTDPAARPDESAATHDEPHADDRGAGGATTVEPGVASATPADAVEGTTRADSGDKNKTPDAPEQPDNSSAVVNQGADRRSEAAASRTEAPPTPPTSARAEGAAGVGEGSRADRRNIMVSPSLLAALREARGKLTMTNTEIWAMAYVNGRDRADELFAKAEWEDSPFARRRRKRVGVGAQSQLRLTLDAAQRQLLEEESERSGAESPSAYVEALMRDFLHQQGITTDRPAKKRS